MNLGRWVLPLLVACTHTQEPLPRPDATPDGPLRPPSTDLVPAVGSEATLEIMTWNIENFPASPFATPAIVADLIASLDVDVVVTQEIASETAWAELAARLADSYDAVLSTHQYTPTDYQKIGVIYRRNLISAGEPTLMFPGDGYAFPRPPLSLPITVDGETIQLVGVHLKCCGEFGDAERRQAAIQALDERFRGQVDNGGESEIVLLGDYNQNLDEEGRTVLAPLLDAPDRYTIRTAPAAAAGEQSYLGFNSFIDHITTTAALDVRWGAATVRVIDPRPQVPGYRDLVSDHLPVVLIAPR